MRAVGYVRVSTEQQMKKGVSLQAQEQKIKAWAELNDSELIGIYSDEGISGKHSDNREGLQAALNAACDNKAVLVFYSLSRVARSTRETLVMADKLQKAGASLHSLSEQIETGSAAGKMMFRLLAVLAEFEADLVSERTRAALAHKKDKGQRIGNIPFGYKLAADGKTLIEDEQEKQLLINVSKLRKKGYTLQQIADRLNKRGKTTRTGREWQYQHVQNLLKPAA